MRFTAAWVYVAMATAGVSLHEKSKEYETACHLLRQLLGTIAYIRIPAIVLAMPEPVEGPGEALVLICCTRQSQQVLVSDARLFSHPGIVAQAAVSVQVVHVAQTGAESGGSAFPSIQSALGGQSSLSRCVMLHSDLSVIVWYTHASFCMQGYVQELYQPGLLQC